MGYVRTAGMSTAARRRRRRTALVLSALVLLLAGVFAYAIAYYQGWLPGSATQDQAQTTSAPTEAALAPADITVNVYNATGPAGAARKTADELLKRGFKVNEVADDPEGATVDGVADIRYGPAGRDAARLLRKSVPGAELVADTRQGKEVDLVLGSEFKKLKTVKKSADTSTSSTTTTG